MKITAYLVTLWVQLQESKTKESLSLHYHTN